MVWNSPANNATGVGVHQSIRFQFDRFLLPSVTTRQALCVQAQSPSGSSANCPNGVFLSPQYDPVDRVLAFTPTGAGLMPGTRYAARLIAPQNDSDLNGVRAFDGVPLAQNTDPLEFTTGDANSPPTLPEPNRNVDFCFTAEQVCSLPGNVCALPAKLGSRTSGPNVALQGCAGTPACHGVPMQDYAILTGTAFTLVGASGGLPAAVRQMVEQSVVATQTATGPSPRAPERSAATPFGQNMPYIDANNPGNSYLLYKLIIGGLNQSQTFDQDYYDCNAINAGLMAGAGTTSCTSTAPFTAMPPKVATNGQAIPGAVDSWVPADQSKPALDDEIPRLRLIIRGQPMPAPAGFYSRIDAETLSAWIAQGASATDCPSQ